MIKRYVLMLVYITAAVRDLVRKTFVALWNR